MAFEIVAERDSETVTMQQSSSLMAIAKARVWASEGWNVTIVVRDETATAPVEECLFVRPWFPIACLISAWLAEPGRLQPRLPHRTAGPNRTGRKIILNHGFRWWARQGSNL